MRQIRKIFAKRGARSFYGVGSRACSRTPQIFNAICSVVQSEAFLHAHCTVHVLYITCIIELSNIISSAIMKLGSQLFSSFRTLTII